MTGWHVFQACFNVHILLCISSLDLIVWSLLIILLCLSHFSCPWNRTPDNWNFEGKKFTLAHGLSRFMPRLNAERAWYKSQVREQGEKGGARGQIDHPRDPPLPAGHRPLSNSAAHLRGGWSQAFSASACYECTRPLGHFLDLTHNTGHILKYFCLLPMFGIGSSGVIRFWVIPCSSVASVIKHVVSGPLCFWS